MSDFDDFDDFDDNNYEVIEKQTLITSTPSHPTLINSLDNDNINDNFNDKKHSIDVMSNPTDDLESNSHHKPQNNFFDQKPNNINMDNISESSNIPSSVNSNVQESEISMGHNEDTGASAKNQGGDSVQGNDTLNLKIMELIQSGEIHK